ncbi:MAG: hypothetical protein ABI282_05155 [Candidatus Baltobacteraceae bacterium]
MAAEKQLLFANARRPFPALAAIGVVLAVTIPLAYVLNIWQDEAFTLQTTSRGLSYAFAQSVRFEQNAPLYFLLLTLWRHLNDSVFFLRVFSILCAALTVWLVPGISRRYVPRADPVLSTFAVAWNPFLIWAALEMRAYALIVVMSALLLLTFFDGFLTPRTRPVKTALYFVCAIACLYTQYYFAFLIAAQAVAVALYRPRAFMRFAVVAAVTVLAFAPMIAIVPGQVANFRGAFTPPHSVFVSAAVLAGILLRYVLALMVPHATALYAALIAGVVAACIIARRAFSANGDSVLLVITASAAAFFAAGVYVAGVHVLNRHAASLYVPAVLGIFAGLTFLRPRFRAAAAIAWFALAMSASSIALVQTYAALAKPGDWIRATAYLRAHERAGEPVVVFEAENALPFAYYYRGPNRIVAIPHGVDFRRYDVTRFVIHGESELRGSMPRADHLWLVTAGECTAANISFGCDALERFVARRYCVASDAKFYLSRLRLLKRAPC